MRSKWTTNERYDFDRSGVRIVHGNVDARSPPWIFEYLNPNEHYHHNLSNEFIIVRIYRQILLYC